MNALEMQEVLLAAAGTLEESAAAIRNYGARVKGLVEAAKTVLARLEGDPEAVRLRAAIALVETRTLREAEALVTGGSDSVSIFGRRMTRVEVSCATHERRHPPLHHDTVAIEVTSAMRYRGTRCPCCGASLGPQAWCDACFRFW